MSPVLVILSSHRRFIVARMIPSRMTGVLLAAGSGRRLDRFNCSLSADGTTKLVSVAEQLCSQSRRHREVFANRIMDVNPDDSESTDVIVERADQLPETPLLPNRSWLLRRMSTPSSTSDCRRPTPGGPGGPARPSDVLDADSGHAGPPPVPPVACFVLGVWLLGDCPSGWDRKITPCTRRPPGVRPGTAYPDTVGTSLESRCFGGQCPCPGLPA